MRGLKSRTGAGLAGVLARRGQRVGHRRAAFRHRRAAQRGFELLRHLRQIVIGLRRRCGFSGGTTGATLGRGAASLRAAGAATSGGVSRVDNSAARPVRLSAGRGRAAGSGASHGSSVADER